jgi:hypothetical protein
MVDIKEIKKTVKTYFIVIGIIQVDPHTGEVDIVNNKWDPFNSILIENKRKGSFTTLPVQFNRVAGDFTCTEKGLIHLKGAPRRVQGDFVVSHNALTSLEGAPSYVGGDFSVWDNPLSSLTGLPTTIRGDIMLTYHTTLPLLRLIDHPFQQLEILQCPKPVLQILSTYCQEGKPGALKAAGELIRAGYKDNARW